MCDDEIREVEADLAATQRMLLRLTASDNIQRLEEEVQKEQVFKLTILIVFRLLLFFIVSLLLKVLEILCLGCLVCFESSGGLERRHFVVLVVLIVLAILKDNIFLVVLKDSVV